MEPDEQHPRPGVTSLMPMKAKQFTAFRGNDGDEVLAAKDAAKHRQTPYHGRVR